MNCRRGRRWSSDMRGKFIGISLLVAASVCCWFLGRGAARVLGPRWSATSQDASVGPLVLLSDTERDFGSVVQGTVLNATFPITNRGGRRLILRQRSQACCGESGTAQAIMVGAGQSHELEIEVDTARWHGAMKHSTVFESNDPRRPRLTFTVRAQVESPAPRTP